MAHQTSLKSLRTLHIDRDGEQAMRLNGRRVTVSELPDGVLPAWLADEMLEIVSSGVGARILLDDCLPPEWQKLNWERMACNGSELGKHAQIIRRYVAAPLSLRHGRSLLLDRWPDNRFIASVQPLIAASRVDARRGDTVDDWLAGTPDLSAYRELFIVAHGAAAPSTLLTETGTPWGWEPPEKLPALVWLLACEALAGGLDGLVDACLSRGACCVVSASGPLSAAHMAPLMAHWLGAAPTSLADWLFGQQQQDSHLGCADALVIHGCLPGDGVPSVFPV
ncbi:hypothetical protein [Propionivibrio dicarboxylicus]|uniref:Uncharacterized protein n=1 Tax=Propionivibrio dicarboxylicus TaxID=83767 RepID=A0A1G8N3X5_9RHOO|nr:hypothetical protein [Propionivibrio dicarboxylicus]SDI74979.1 hypothetical protein SAMN05660652_03975 [Propionivibrio dicarboxylicus]